MIIAVICDILGGENNGTAVATMNLVRYLEEEGHTVRLVCGDADRILNDDTYVLPSIHLVGSLKRYVARIGVSLAKYDKPMLEGVLKGVDYIHCTMPFGISIEAAKYAKEHGIPISAGFHFQAENILSYVGLQRIKFLEKFTYKYLYKRFFKYVDAIHYPTQFIRRTFESCIKRQTNGYVISNGVNKYIGPAQSRKPNEYKDKYVLLSVGRYTWEKSQDTLIKAVAKSKYRDRIQVILAGKGQRDKYYARLAKKYRVAVDFKTFKHEDMNDVINYCDMYVHPAVVELEGIACLEAIKCCKLTLVSDSDSSATKELVPDERCVFRKHCARDLARLIDWWMDNPGEKQLLETKMQLADTVRYVDECMLQMDKMIEEVYARKSLR